MNSSNASGFLAVLIVLTKIAMTAEPPTQATVAENRFHDSTRLLAESGNATIIGIGPLGGSPLLPARINDSGEIVGKSTANHAFHYAGGVVTDLGTLGKTNSDAVGISSTSAIACNSWDSKTVSVTIGTVTLGINQLAQLVSNGSATPIGPHPGRSASSVYSQSDNGLTLGDSFNWKIEYVYFLGIPYDAYVAKLDQIRFVYSGGQLNDLQGLPSGNALPTRINNQGVIIGYINTQYRRGFVTINGTSTIIEPPSGEDTGTTDAKGINNLGVIVGDADTGFFLYDQGVTQDLPLPHDAGLTTVDINDLEQIIGNSAYGPFLYQNGETIFLQNAIPADSGWVLKNVVDLNNLGQIIGTATRNGTETAFLLSGPLSINGNQPPKLFVNSFSTNLTINTTTPAGTILNDYNAFDPDTGQTLTFSIVSGNLTGAFALHPTTGVLSLNRQLRIPRTHQLKIRVTDNGSPPLSNDADITIHVVRPE